MLAVPADPKSALRARPPTDAVDQVDKQFVPYVKVVFVGAKVGFPNSDRIRHQVYSFSPAKKFELPLYGGTDAPPVVFDKPGVVVLGCNIHDWMIGYIYVSETPFFAKTGPGGTAVIDDCRRANTRCGSGIREWTGRSSPPRGRVTVGADGSAGAEWEINLKPAFRVPRVSGAASAGYP